MAAETAAAERWIEEFRRATDEDPEIQAHGKYYSCSYLLDMEEHSYLVKMHGGKVEEILVDPGPLDDRYQFALRASAGTWRKFGEEVPEPMYHGIWSASFQRDLKLEGDLLVLMQNLRCFTRQFELLRKTGVPV
nr:hypothetical protein [Rubrobacter taiwanensis]